MLPVSVPATAPPTEDVVLKIGTAIPQDTESPLINLDAAYNRFGVVPMQMFALPNKLQNRPGRKPLSFVYPAPILASVANLIDRTGILLYIHGPYNINFCWPAPVDNPSNTQWGLNIVRSNFVNAIGMHSRGVVWHVGKMKTEEEIRGLPRPKNPVYDQRAQLERMFYFIRQSLQFCTPQCPFLLETPAGQGNEICTTLEDMSLMYGSFSAEERTRMFICVDTCHVFSSGYDPMEYLTRWNEAYPGSIRLVHLNDSENPKGSHVDRHACPGQGYIGREKMEEVVAFCRSLRIPMVLEC